MNYLTQLESESIYIIREVVSEMKNPVMLYSIGKDSSVMLHLAKKAFYPNPLPFSLLHVDTCWKFKEMIAFREKIVSQGIDVLVWKNQEAIDKGIDLMKCGSEIHTKLMKTEALKQALNFYKFDSAFGGARRDEEKSRAKERVFSFRNKFHQWDVKRQNPEIWNIYNTKINDGESMRIFPLSSWSEIDVWQYIKQEGIDVVPLYFSKMRNTVKRDNVYILLDDDRLELKDNEIPEYRNVRFRSLGCYPLSGGVISNADTVDKIIEELKITKYSERQVRLIDTDISNMEIKKQEGYF